MRKLRHKDIMKLAQSSGVSRGDATIQTQEVMCAECKKYFTTFCRAHATRSSGSQTLLPGRPLRLSVRPSERLQPPAQPRGQDRSKFGNYMSKPPINGCKEGTGHLMFFQEQCVCMHVVWAYVVCTCVCRMAIQKHSQSFTACLLSSENPGDTFYTSIISSCTFKSPVRLGL